MWFWSLIESWKRSIWETETPHFKIWNTSLHFSRDADIVELWWFQIWHMELWSCSLFNALRRGPILRYNQRKAQFINSSRWLSTSWFDLKRSQRFDQVNFESGFRSLIHSQIDLESLLDETIKQQTFLNLYCSWAWTN